MTSATAPDGPQNDETVPDQVDAAEPSENTPETSTEGSGDVFPRAYVSELRKESAGYRDRAKQAEANADAYARRLHAELVKATGKLENPDELPFDAEHLDNPDALGAALAALLDERPYLAKRVIAGDIGQGSRGDAKPEVSLLDLMRRGT